ncbi:MAG: hypothetical protein AB7V04_03100 [Desulfomonilaceae bacterium]
MNEISSMPDDFVFDSTKYLRLEIDKDGKWFQNGAEIIHPGIRSQFYKALNKKADGDYFVKIGREICSVIVHDAPFVVTQVDQTSDGSIYIKLNDGTQEQLVPDRLWIGKENVPYVMVKLGAFHARFSRPAYYQLARWIVFKEAEGKFYFSHGDNQFELRIKNNT